MAEAIQIASSHESALSYTSQPFVKPPTDLRYKKITFQSYHPTNSLTNTEIANFSLPAWKSKTFYQLEKAVYVLELSLVQENGEALPNNSRSAFVNNILHSIIKKQSIYLNDVCINSSTDNFNYKQYMEINATFNQGCKNAILQSQGYYQDTANQFDNTLYSNNGFKDRLNLYSQEVPLTESEKTAKTPIKKTKVRKFSKLPVTYVGRIGADLDGDIPNGINIRVELAFENAKFCIMTNDTTYKVKYYIHSLVLHCPVAEIEDSVYLSLDRGIQQKPFLMPYIRREITTMSINKGEKTFLSDTLFTGASNLPSKLAVVFVETDAFRGDLKKNPFDFKKSFGGESGEIAEILSQGLYLNGNLIDGFQSDKPEIDFFKMSLYAGFVESGFTNGLSLNDYQGGNYITNHDLTTSAGSNCSTLLSPGIRVGHCRYEVKFSQSLPVNVTMILLNFFPSTLEIDRSRKVITTALTN